MTDAPHLVAVNRFYWPDHSATSQLLTDLCEHAAARGFRVTVIASRMRYDAPEVRLPARENRNGVDIRRVFSTRMGRTSTLGRISDYLSFYFPAFFSVLAAAGRGDTILVKTDPPLISVPCMFAAQVRGARLVNWLQDLFPEVGEVLGVSWASGRPGRWLRELRNRSLRAAALNVVISQPMKERVQKEGVSGSGIQVIENWPSGEIHPIAPSENALRDEWGLTGRFVIGYSGNLGRAHCAEQIADLVRRTAHVSGLSWVFIGGGQGLELVRSRTLDCGADVHWKPYQPRSKLSESLSVSDMHLVSLDPACEGLIMPSKLYGILAAGRPVLALGDPNGAVAKEVTSARVGVALDITAPESWSEIVSEAVTSEECGAMGVRARLRYEAAYRQDRLMDKWLKALSRGFEDHDARPACAS